MMTIALALLFAAAGLFALASIAASLHRLAAIAPRLRRALGACPRQRELRLAITEFRVSLPEQARILRPDFGVRALARPAPARLRAAA